MGRICEVLADVAARVRASGRDPAAVTVVAVTKTLSPRAVAWARAAGLHDVGENYVQEARDKRAACGDGMTWHLIGTLQRNKASAAARVFDRIHSLGNAEMARALDAAADREGRSLPVLVQVDTAGHPAGHGVQPHDLLALVRAVRELRHLALDGLMCLAPPDAPTSTVRGAFASLRELRDDTARATGLELPHLSMGMSDDYPIAIEEGATMLRLGRALFGARGEAPWREAK